MLWIYSVCDNPTLLAHSVAPSVVGSCCLYYAPWRATTLDLPLHYIQYEPMSPFFLSRLCRVNSSIFSCTPCLLCDYLGKLTTNVVIAIFQYYGPKGVFYKLSLECFEGRGDKYTYKLCPFHKAEQSWSHVPGTVIGRNPTWISMGGEGGYQLVMEAGDSSGCPDHGSRETIVRKGLHCCLAVCK